MNKIYSTNMLKISCFLLCLSALSIPMLHAQDLPDLNQLVQEKFTALNTKEKEQTKLLALIDNNLQEAQSAKDKTFDNNAYISLSSYNRAPSSEYRLESREIFLDNKLISKSLDNNHKLYFALLSPGCHEVHVKATYVRLKNTLVNRFKNINKKEYLSKTQAFIAHDGHSININVEGFEQINSLVNLFRGPALRFNNSLSPNFLNQSSLPSLDSMLMQGRALITFESEDAFNHSLAHINLSIDGMPILVNEEHKNNNNIIFEAPISEGSHKLSISLIFNQNKRVKIGPSYNYKLSFERDFKIVSGQITKINLIAMPNDGFRNRPQDSRYAEVTTKIIGEQSPEIFINKSCKEYGQKPVQGPK